ncbi:ABC transporter permease [Microbacterium soli]|uniref:ABC transporter permease n=1 Tax=Microbacterium soli TaxID=446075 RepID=A0ABP7NK98_9MICO
MRNGLSPFLKVVVGVVALLLVAPTLIVIPMSFSSGTTFRFPPRGWSLRWYEELLTDPAWLDSISRSLLIGFIVMVVAGVCGTLVALGLHYGKFRGSGLIESLVLAPMVAPTIVLAVSVYISFLYWNLTGTLLGYVLAHAMLAIPFVYVSVNTSLKSLDPILGNAAASLGSTPMRTFRRVTFPLVLPGVLAGMVFAFVTSFDEVVVSLFIRSPGTETLPVRMFNSVTLQIDPTISAAASVVVVLVTAVILTAQLVFVQRKQTK